MSVPSISKNNKCTFSQSGTWVSNICMPFYFLDKIVYRCKHEKRNKGKQIKIFSPTKQTFCLKFVVSM